MDRGKALKVTGIVCLLIVLALAALKIAKMKQSGNVKKPVPEANSGIEKPGWVLTFHDEFDKPNLNTTKWYTFDTRDVKANYFIKNGILHLRIDKQLPKVGGKFSRCSTIRSRPVRTGKEWPNGKPFTQKYGWFETRARCPKGSGRHAAFWLMTPDKSYLKLKKDGGTRQSYDEAYEVDIFEQLGKDPFSNVFTVHFGRPYDKEPGSECRTLKFSFDHSKDFHIYALEWSEKILIWYVDGKEVRRSNKVPQEPFLIILSVHELLPGEKGWTGRLDSNPSYPCDFEVDYIRVFKKTQTKSGK